MLYKDVKIALKPVPFPYRGHLPTKSFLSGAFKYAFRISIALRNLPEPTYLLYHHSVTNFLSSPKQATPLFSINSTLLWQITGVGVFRLQASRFKPSDRTSSLQKE
jgi:hypothetical protein